MGVFGLSKQATHNFYGKTDVYAYSLESSLYGSGVKMALFFFSDLLQSDLLLLADPFLSFSLIFSLKIISIKNLKVPKNPGELSQGIFRPRTNRIRIIYNMTFMYYNFFRKMSNKATCICFGAVNNILRQKS